MTILTREKETEIAYTDRAIGKLNAFRLESGVD